jgi:Protein of unknown function (DUF1579)
VRRFALVGTSKPLEEGFMKHPVASVALVIPFLVVAALAQAPVPSPGPEHKRLHVWNGDWNCEMERQASPSGPGIKRAFKLSVKMILGGFAQESEQKDPSGVTRTLYITAYDSFKKVYTSNGYASNGGTISSVGTVNGAVWDWSTTVVAEGTQFWIKEKDTLSADMQSFIGTSESSDDGQSWNPAPRFRCTKAQAEKQK